MFNSPIVTNRYVTHTLLLRIRAMITTVSIYFTRQKIIVIRLCTWIYYFFCFYAIKGFPYNTSIQTPSVFFVTKIKRINFHFSLFRFTSDKVIKELSRGYSMTNNVNCMELSPCSLCNAFCRFNLTGCARKQNFLSVFQKSLQLLVSLIRTALHIFRFLKPIQFACRVNHNMANICDIVFKVHCRPTYVSTLIQKSFCYCREHTPGCRIFKQCIIFIDRCQTFYRCM